MTPWTEAKAWALREVWRDERKKGNKTGDYGLCTYVAPKLTVKGEGKKVGGNPSPSALRQLYEKMDQDKDWFPGKRYGDPPGRPSALSETNKAVVARSLMAFSRDGGEPTYPMAIAFCPQATINPETGKPVGKRSIYDIMESKCHDGDPEEPWRNRPTLSKTMLTPEEMERRLAWGRYMQTLRHGAAWYFWHIVGADICNNILPRSFKKAALQAQARKSGRKWMSEGSQKKATNLRDRRSH